MPFDRGQCQIPYPSPGPKGWGFQLTGALQLDADRDLIFGSLSDRLIRFSFISLSSLLCYFSVAITNHADK